MPRLRLEAKAGMIVEGTHTIEGGISACAQLLAGPNTPTAILCSNDMNALGVMRKSNEEGLIIRKDLSVIGFDDIRLAQFVLPALTTVQMSQAELARLAFNAWLAEIKRETPTATGTEYILTTHLVLHESTHLAPGPNGRKLKT